MHYVTRFRVFWLWDDLEHKMLIADDTIDKTDKHLKTKNVAQIAAYKCSQCFSVKPWYRFCVNTKYILKVGSWNFKMIDWHGFFQGARNPILIFSENLKGSISWSVASTHFISMLPQFDNSCTKFSELHAYTNLKCLTKPVSRVRNPCISIGSYKSETRFAKCAAIPGSLAVSDSNMLLPPSLYFLIV